MRIVENTPARLVLRERPPWVGMLVLAAMGLVIIAGAVSHASLTAQWPALVLAVIAFTSFRNSRATFDKARRICAVRRFDLGGLRRWDLAFDDIVDVRVEPPRRDRGLGAMCSRLILVTTGAAVPLTLNDEPGPERHGVLRDEILGALSPAGRSAAAA